MFPETSGRTLEELAFSTYPNVLKFKSSLLTSFFYLLLQTVFEGNEVRKRQAKETEQEVIAGHMGPPMALTGSKAGSKHSLHHVESKKEEA
jgi:hypothetical protein